MKSPTRKPFTLSKLLISIAALGLALGVYVWYSRPANYLAALLSGEEIRIARLEIRQGGGAVRMICDDPKVLGFFADRMREARRIYFGGGGGHCVIVFTFPNCRPYSVTTYSEGGSFSLCTTFAEAMEPGWATHTFEMSGSRPENVDRLIEFLDSRDVFSPATMFIHANGEIEIRNRR